MLVDFTSFAFMEQQDPPSFLALDIEQLAAFSAVHSFALEALQWSSDAFFAEAPFIEQHDDELLAFAVAEQDSLLPAYAADAHANAPTTIRAIVRKFIVVS